MARRSYAHRAKASRLARFRDRNMVLVFMGPFFVLVGVAMLAALAHVLMGPPLYVDQAGAVASGLMLWGMLGVGLSALGAWCVMTWFTGEAL